MSRKGWTRLLIGFIVLALVLVVANLVVRASAHSDAVKLRARLRADYAKAVTVGDATQAWLLLCPSTRARSTDADFVHHLDGSIAEVAPISGWKAVGDSIEFTTAKGKLVRRIPVKRESGRYWVCGIDPAKPFGLQP